MKQLIIQVVHKSNHTTKYHIINMLCLAMLLCVSSVTATDFIVNPSINNPPYNGSPEHPFVTIQQAIDSLNTTGHIPVPDSIVTFQIMQGPTGTYNENIQLNLDLGASDIVEWNFKAYNHEAIRIAGDANAPLIVSELAMVSNMWGADISFENIIFRPDIPTINTGFFSSAPCIFGKLTFSNCEFSNLYYGILITEPQDTPNEIPIMFIDDFVVRECNFDEVKNEGKGIYTWARNMQIGGDNHKFINKIHIYENMFRTDGIVNPVPNYTLTNIRITNYRKDAVAYDSVFVFNNIFANENPDIKSFSIFFDGLNRQRLYYEFDNKCKAYTFENELTNNRVYAEISDLKYNYNKAIVLDNTDDKYIKFISNPEYGLDTLWTEWNYSRSPNAYEIENAVLIDKQNSFIGTSSFLRGSYSNIYFTNSLITEFETIFDVDGCIIESQYCYYDQILNDDNIIYGDGIVSGNPQIEPDPSGFSYSFIWNESVKSPCIMAAYDEEFNQLEISPDGTTAYDKLDIGAIQYSEHLHEWINYGFPSANQRNGIRWMSFPTADRILNNPDNYDMALTLFNPLIQNRYTVEIQWKSINDVSAQMIFYDYSIPAWQNLNLDHEVNPLQGYKFTMNPSLQTPVSIITEGIYPSINNEIPLVASDTLGRPNENWIGYYGKQTLSPFDAFRNVIDNLYMIKTQNWCMVRSNYQEKSLAEWIYVFDHNNPHTISYGDMAVVYCYENGSFHWPSYGTELEPYELEEIEHFAYIEKPDYKPFFIDFEGTTLPKEVGLYIDDICMGAAKVVQDSVEIRAYLLEGLPEYPDIEFRLYYETRANDIISSYSVMDNKTGEFSLDRLKLDNNQHFYIVRIYTDDTESSPIPRMYIANYPNPFNPGTKIEYYLPQESKVCLDIFDVKGQKVINLVNEIKSKGINQVYWNGTSSNGNNVSSGVYFASFRYKGKQITNKITLMK